MGTVKVSSHYAAGEQVCIKQRVKPEDENEGEWTHSMVCTPIKYIFHCANIPLYKEESYLDSSDLLSGRAACHLSTPFLLHGC